MDEQRQVEAGVDDALRVTLTSKDGMDTASALIAGEQVEVRSRHGAVLALARVAKDRMPSDYPVEVYNPDGALLLRYPSLHRAALYTITEGPQGERMVRWKPRKL